VAFFQAFEGMEEGFRARALRVNELLAARETAFVLVASPRRDTLAEARYFAGRLAEGGIKVDGLVVNRVHPRFGDGLAEATRARAGTLGATSELGAFYANLADLQAVAAAERDHLAGLDGVAASAPVTLVPFLGSDVHDLAGLGEVAEHLYPGTGGST
jgi:anion-transporting  ArsA/GET3 family ATPase